MGKTKGLTIELMDIATGEIRRREGHPWTADPDYRDIGTHYEWTERNWACDCNRWPEWLQAGGMSNAEAYALDAPVDERTRGYWCQYIQCAEGRIAARCLEGTTEPFDDFPENEEERLALAAEIKAAHEKRQLELDKTKPNKQSPMSC